MTNTHPVELVVQDDLRRSRLAVFFRLVLLIPHVIWFLLWSIAVLVVAVLGWVAALATGRLPGSFHRFFCSYIRYSVHLGAFYSLVADPFPEFNGGGAVFPAYPVDVRLPEPVAQARWRIALRLVLALPAFFFSFALGGFGATSSSSKGSSSSSTTTTGLTFVVAVFGWFASLFTGRMPRGLRDAGAYTVGYRTQVLAYVLLVTDRYPDADPTAMLANLERPPVHPVHIVGDAVDLRRSRVTVFFRLALAIPHLVWLFLWTVPVVVVVVLQWFVTLLRGRPIAKLHGFVARFVRYQLHVYAFLFLVANPFPGFTGLAGTYPLDLVLPVAERQNRWKTLFRGVLALPALVLSGTLSSVMVTGAVLTWFAALLTGRAPEGLRNASAYVLRYNGQMAAYVYLLTDAYPHASPLEGGDPDRHQEFEEVAAEPAPTVPEPDQEHGPDAQPDPEPESE